MEPKGNVYCVYKSSSTTYPYPEADDASLCTHPSYFLRSIVYLSTHLYLVLQSGFFLAGLSIKMLSSLFFSQLYVGYPTHLMLDSVTLMMFGEE